MIVIDSFQHPELVPDHGATSYGDRISFSRYRVNGDRKEFRQFLFGVILTPSIHLPAYIWRWAIKSTAWFYLYLLIVPGGWIDHRSNELVAWGKAYTRIKSNWISLLISVALLAVSLAPLVGWIELMSLKENIESRGAPFSLLLIFFVVDWSALLNQPWYWFYIPSFMLTILLFFTIDSINNSLAAGGDRRKLLAKLHRCLWMSNIRFVLTSIGLGISLIYIWQVSGAGQHVINFLA